MKVRKGRRSNCLHILSRRLRKRDCQRLKRQRAFSNACASGKENKQFNGRTIKMKEMILEERQRLRSMDQMSLVMHAIEYRKRYLP